MSENEAKCLFWNDKLVVYRIHTSHPCGCATSAPIVPLVATFCPRNTESSRRPSIDKIRKCGAREFKGKTEDNPLGLSIGLRIHEFSMKCLVHLMIA